jgi:hypothetical protein
MGVLLCALLATTHQYKAEMAKRMQHHTFHSGPPPEY